MAAKNLYYSGVAKGSENQEKSVGGIPFFIGFLALPIVLVSLIILTVISVPYFLFVRLPIYAIAFALGFFLSKLILTRNKGVYFHELRHALVSTFVGNKGVKMSVARKTGSYEYKYSKQKEKYNAFIALAPYILPLWSILGLLTLIFAPGRYVPYVLGIALGFDVEQWWRDLSPHQTDISNITGGVLVGMLFVCIFETVIMLLTTIIVLSGSQFFSACTDFFVLVAKRVIGHS